MKGKLTYKNGFITGSIAIVIAIILGITLQNEIVIAGIRLSSDIGFVFAGLGTVIIGFSFLSYINKKEKKEDDK